MYFCSHKHPPMKSTTDKSHALFPLFVLYLLMLGAPCCLAWADDGSFHFAKAKFIVGCFTAIFPALALSYLASFGRRLRHIITATLALLMFAAFFLFINIHAVISQKVIALVAQTDAGECGEFFSQYVLQPSTLLSVGLCLIIIAAWMGYRHLYNRRMTWASRFLANPRGRRIALRAALAAGLLSAAWTVIGYCTEYYYMASYPTVEQLGIAFYRYYRSRPDMRLLEDAVRNTDGALSSGSKPMCIIWVIGESMQKRHASVYGYRLPTTPTMERELRNGNLLVFNDVVTPSAATHAVMARIFSPYSDDDTIPWERQPLIPAIFRHAGYRVGLHDNQTTSTAGDFIWDEMNMSFFDSPAVSDASFDYRNTSLSAYDSDFCRAELPRTLLRAPALEIFHLIGQHIPADRRYPEAYARFDTGDYDWRDDLDERRRSDMAHYDNATFHNDSVLSCIFRAVRDIDAIVIYHTDHGEEIYDYRDRYGRILDPVVTRGTIEALYEAFMVVYTTPKFRRLHPEMYRRLKEAVDHPFSIADISHTLMDIGGISSRYYKPGRSLLSPMRYRIRRPIADGTCDYDSVISAR